MRIAIDVNGVLRDTIGKFTQLYEKHLIDSYQDEFVNVETFELDSSGNTELQLTKPFKYEILSDVNSLNLRNHFSFQSDEELYDFMYREFPMQIFGHAGSTEISSMNDLNDFYLDFRDIHDMLIVSDEIGKSKPATLFFLSKFGCLLEKIKFFSNSTQNLLWDELDILLTANPDLLLNYPKNKLIIKFETSYNEEIKTEHSISSFKEFKNIIKNLN
jgi:hypothetical protein